MSIAEYVAIAKQVGVGRAASVVDAVAALPGSPELIADTLRSHHLLGFVQRAVRESGAPDRLSQELLAALA